MYEDNIFKNKFAYKCKESTLRSRVKSFTKSLQILTLESLLVAGANLTAEVFTEEMRKNNPFPGMLNFIEA